MIVDQILFRKVRLSDVKLIQKLFVSVFKKKISKSFYLEKYIYNNNFTSFVAVYNQKIIGHVGFVQYVYSYDESQIFSRHSSFIINEYRNLSIYKKLCLYAYQNLYDPSNYKIVSWPNAINNLSKPHTKFFFKKEKYLIFKKKNFP